LQCVHFCRRDKGGKRHRRPSRENAHDKNLAAGPNYSAAQVVAVGGGKYGIVWNGQLRDTALSSSQLAPIATPVPLRETLCLFHARFVVVRQFDPGCIVACCL
jgi:hypothetical protein